MIHLTYSNRTESLMDRLAAAIQAERQRRSPWEPIHLVTPNPFLKEYLSLQLARRLGVAANLRFTYLEGLWQGLLPAGGFRLLNADLLRGALLAIFADGAWLAQESLAPVRRYLQDDGRGLKAVQLASELARLFEEYARNRPEWLPGWRAQATLLSPAPELELWQRLLWLEAVARLDATGRRHLTLGEALLDPAFGKGDLPPAIHAFGLTHVAQVYHQAYLRLGQATELHLYALNPCGEFWEDLTTVGEALWRQRRPSREEARLGPWQPTLGDEDNDCYGLAAEGPEALRRWGRPGRENIRLLNDVSQCDFDTCFEVPAGATLLHQLQGDILRFEEPAEDAQGAPDGTVRFLACPSLRREAEVVATEIWRLMEARQHTDQPLGFSEIAVVVPPGQEAAYTAHLQAAFQETRQIPWTRGDGAPPVLAQTLEGADLLLALPLSGFTRAAMLGILTHPSLSETFGEIDAGAWTRWCQALGIVRGADRADWADTYLDSDALNWDQGLKRLALGAFMAEGAELELQGTSYLSLGAADAASAGRFLALTRGLLADARRLARTRQDLRGWVADLETFLATWLQGEDEPTVRAVERIRTFLRRLLESAPEGLDLPDLGFAAARELALEALQRLRGEQPSSLARGVVVSCYAPMRAIPFRAVFLLGLGEGIFPGRDQRSALDLRAKGRRPGDVSQAEKDKYLFLETLLSTREYFCCSYVAKDDLTGEALEPSGLYKDCLALAGRYVAPELRAGLSQRHPLRRFDPAYFPAYFPGCLPGSGELRTYSLIAQAEARALWLGLELRQGEALALPGSLGELGAPEALQASLATWLAHPGSGQAKGAGPLLRLSLADLRRWLECPLTGAAAVRLGLRRAELEDRAAVADEPFESEFLDTYSLQREVTLEAAREGRPCEEIYAAAVKRLQARGEAPFGVFADGERKANLQPVRGWLALLDGGSPVTWRLGPSRSAKGQTDRVEPALMLAVNPGGRALQVELVGELTPQLLGGSLFLEAGKAPGKTALNGLRKKALKAYLDHLLLACVGEGAGAHRAWFLFGGKDGQAPSILRFVFEPLTGGEARAILGAWVEDLLEGDHAVLLPIEAVLDSYEQGGPTAASIREYVDGKLEKSGDRGGLFSTLYGPVPAPWRFEPPAEPRVLAERRLGAFFEQVATLEEQDEA